MIQWTDDQRAFRAGLRQWCAAFDGGSPDGERSTSFEPDRWKLVCESGVLGLPFEQRWGGLGQDLLTTMFVLEGLGYGCRDGGLCFAVTTHVVSAGIPLQRFGTEAQKARYLPAVCQGTAIAAHAISEPDSGSDALNMRTTARESDDGWVINGSKTFVSNAPVADLFVVYARTRADAGPLGITAFLVERDNPGVRVGRPIAKMGLSGAPIAEVFLDDCVVPAGQVLGRPGSGFLVLDHVMKWEILCSFVVNVGEMTHRLERCLRYAKQRVQFGQPIGSFQAVSHRLVDMHLGVETARKWLYDTAEKFLAGANVTTDIAACKLLASEANLASAIAAVRTFGGNGYMTEFGLEADLRNAVGGVIYSGTSDIQRNRIASMMGL